MARVTAPSLSVSNWSGFVPRQQAQEFLAERRVAEKGSPHDAVRHARFVVFHASPVHAEVAGFHWEPGFTASSTD